MSRTLLTLLAVATLASCDSNSRIDETRDAAPAVSLDSFCFEHGVTEAVCTRCNPKLIAIFKDQGDWCEEHEFPESFCPSCHPELGGKPTAEIGAGPPATGTIVKLASRDIARRAGIEVVEARAVSSAPELSVLGSISYDESRRALVNARARGVVREIHVELGQHLSPNDPLFRIESADVGADVSRLAAASSRVEVAQAAYERTTSLFDKGIAAKRDLLDAQLELDTAKSERAATQALLGVVGARPEQGGNFVLVAPITGTCVRRHASIGSLVEAGDVLCEIVDTSAVWADLAIPERDLGVVRPGLEVMVSAGAASLAEFHGRIDYVVPEIDPHSRTATARVRIENPDGSLRANSFVQARIVLGPKQANVLVPRSALQLAKGAELMFVELEPGNYETRRVRSVALHADMVALAEGVAAGERVVTSGSFLLKTETLKGEIGAGCCAAE